MQIQNYAKSPQAQNPHGISATKLYDYEHGQIMHIELSPGEALKPHETPTDVVFYVLEGQPEILVGGERRQVDKDDLVESPRDIVHCIYNETEEPVRVLVMKLPRPTTATRMVQE